MSRQREAGPIPRLLLLSTLVCPLPLLAAADPKSWAEAVRQADQLLNAGNYDASLDTLAIALDMAGSSSHTALTLLRIGSIDFELGRFRDAERAYLKALALWTKPGPPKLDRSEALIGLGGVYLKTGDLAKAERYARLGLQSREETLGPHHIDLGGPLQNLAAVYQAQHRYAEAKDLFSRAIVLLESGTGDRRGIAAARRCRHPGGRHRRLHLANCFRSGWASTRRRFERPRRDLLPRQAMARGESSDPASTGDHHARIRRPTPHSGADPPDLRGSAGPHRTQRPS